MAKGPISVAFRPSPVNTRKSGRIGQLLLRQSACRDLGWEHGCPYCCLPALAVLLQLSFFIVGVCGRQRSYLWCGQRPERCRCTRSQRSSFMGADGKAVLSAVTDGSGCSSSRRLCRKLFDRSSCAVSSPAARRQTSCLAIKTHCKMLDIFALLTQASHRQMSVRNRHYFWEEQS